MKRGQRIKLNERGITWQTSSAGAPARRHADWRNRAGTIGRITKRGDCAAIYWDGNRTLSDAVPLRFLEAVA